MRYPRAQEIKQIADNLNLMETKVKLWFKNRRYRNKVMRDYLFRVFF